MLNFRRAPSLEDSGCSANRYPISASPGSIQARPFVRRRLSPEGGRALEILGHAIEYLADEYANDPADKGPLGSADPRVAAIQILKGLNRAIYYSATEMQPALHRVKRWLLGPRTMVR
jgi:hypothetical protein